MRKFQNHSGDNCRCQNQQETRSLSSFPSGFETSSSAQRSATLALPLLLAVLTRPSVRADDALTAIPERAFFGWSELSSSLTGLRGSFVESRSVTVKGQEVVNTIQHFEFGTTDNGTFIIEVEDGRTSVGAVNPDYGFSAVQESHDSQFEPNLIRRNEKLRRQLERDVRDYFEPFLFAGFEIMGKTMPDLVQSSDFELQSLSEDDNSALVSMRFAYSPPDSQRDTAITGGLVTFDTQHHWAIESFECDTVWGSVEGTVKYRDFNGILVPTSYLLVSRGDAAASIENREFQLVNIEPLQHDAAPIRLSDYGITEPEKVISVRYGKPLHRWFLIFNVLGLAILFAGYYLLRRRGRRRQPSS